MKRNKLFWKKLLLAALPMVFVIFALLYPSLKLDNSILFLILLAVLIIVLPWERLTSLKAAGLELVLEKPQVDKAIVDLPVLKGKENVDDEKLRKVIEYLVPQIEEAKGARILWIDDAPDNILGERRLLRALGIETVMATSSKMAQSNLDTDGDFDLIISDVRSGEKYEKGESEIVEAVQFIKDLREREIKRSSTKRYVHIPSLPVIFYSGKHYNELLRLTESVRRKESVIILVRDTEKLFEEIIRTLAYVRSEPIKIVVGSTSSGTAD